MRFLSSLKKINRFILLVYFVVALVISYFILYRNLITFVQSTLPQTSMVLSLEPSNSNAVQHYEVWITEVGNKDGTLSLEDVIDSAYLCEGFQYRAAADYGYGSDVITNTAGEKGVLELPWDGDGYIKFWKQELSGVVKITTNSQAQVIDLYSNELNQYESVSISSCVEIPVFYQTIAIGCAVLLTIILFMLLSIWTANLINKSE